MTDNEETPLPWERQKSEPISSYSLFNEFIQLGPLRSLSKLQQKVTNIPKFDPTPTLDAIKKMSSRWNWIKRAEAYEENKIEEQRGKIESRAIKRVIDRFDKSKEIENKINEKIICILEHPDFDKNFSKNAYAVSELSKSKKVELESQRLDLGEPTIIQKSDIDAKVKTKDNEATEEFNRIMDKSLKNIDESE